MDAYKKNHHIKFIYISLCYLSFLITISGCGGGEGVSGMTETMDTKTLSSSYDQIMLPTCTYPEIITEAPPLNLPEVPQVPSIVTTGTVYHVDKDKGSNINNGSSINPWETIQYGLDQLNAGDTLIIHEALSEYSEQLHISTSGTDMNWITVKGADGENVLLQNGKITFKNSSKYILFENVEIKSSGWSPLSLNVGAHHLVFDNLDIDCQSSTDNYTGVWISAGVNHIWFKDMDIHNCGFKKINPSDCSGVCLKEPSISEVTFLDVTVRDNKGDGIGSDSDLANTIDSVYFDGCISMNNTGDGFDINSRLAVFYNTISAENGGDQGNGFKTWSKETWLINSHTYKNDYIGVVNKPLYKDSAIYILNSTFVGDNRHIFGGEVSIVNLFMTDISDLSSNNVFLYNNIFHTFNTAAVVFQDIGNQTLAGENNNYYFSENDNIAFEIRDNLAPDRFYTISEIGDGTLYASEGFGANDIGMILDNNNCQLN